MSGDTWTWYWLFHSVVHRSTILVPPSFSATMVGRITNGSPQRCCASSRALADTGNFHVVAKARVRLVFTVAQAARMKLSTAPRVFAVAGRNAACFQK